MMSSMREGPPAAVNESTGSQGLRTKAAATSLELANVARWASSVAVSTGAGSEGGCGC